MRIDQRNAGASFTIPDTNPYYVLDRWQARFQTGSGHTVQRVTDAPSGFTYSQKITVGTGAAVSTTVFNRLVQNIEGYNSSDLGYGTASAKTVTASFWVKSSLTGIFGAILRNASNLRFYAGSYTINSANTWEYKTITIPGDTTVVMDDVTTGIGLVLAFDLGDGPDRSIAAGSWQTTSTTTYGLTGGVKLVETSGATWQVAGVQLEVGSVASSFEYRPYGVELALCQRYYQQSTSAIGGGYATAAGQTARCRCFVNFMTDMRAAPTFTNNATFTLSNATSTVNTYNLSGTGHGFSLTSSAAGDTYFYINTGSLDYSAEL
jgi:hypothetical protein